MFFFLTNVCQGKTSALRVCSTLYSQFIISRNEFENFQIKMDLDSFKTVMNCKPVYLI